MAILSSARFCRGMRALGCGIVLAGLAGLTGCGGTIDPHDPKLPTFALERAIAILQLQYQSKDEGTRANCVEAVQPLDDPRAASIIEQALHDESEVVRFAGCMAVGKRHDKRYRPTVQGLLANDKNDSVRVAAVYALFEMGDTANMNLLGQTIKSSDPATRANTALVLGYMGDKSAIPLLKRFADDAEAPVHFEITAALARLGDSYAQRLIVAAIARSKYAEDEWMAMEVCADLPAEIGANALLPGLQPPPAEFPPTMGAEERNTVLHLTTRRQLVAARSLGKLHSLQGVDVALKNLENADPGLRALALLALGEMLSPQEMYGIVKYLQDPDEGVERAAAAAVIRITARARAATRPAG